MQSFCTGTTEGSPSSACAFPQSLDELDLEAVAAGQDKSKKTPQLEDRPKPPTPAVKR